MELELRAYRAEPSDARFNAVYRVARPWLESAAFGVLRGYQDLSPTAALDDLVVEGAYALSRSARRYVFICECGRAFVDRRRLSEHQREVHGIRGGVPLVELGAFARTSARLAIRRTARRMIRPETPDSEVERLVDVSGSMEVEDSILFDLLIRSVRARLTSRARLSLEAFLRDVDVPAFEVDILRSEVLELLRRGDVLIQAKRFQEVAR